MKPISLKKILLLKMLFVVAATTVYAQGGPRQLQERYRQFESQRIAFITRELSLTPDEAQAFWPVYNEYNEKRNQLMIRHRSQRTNENKLDELSDEQLHELADADISNMEEMTALRRQYHQKFKEILPIKKVVKLYAAERDFNRHLFNENRQGRMGRGRN